MEDVIEKAKNIVEGHASDRNLGRERSMKKIVQVFNELTGKDLTEHDGDIFMVCLKLVRMQLDKFGEDHYIDAIGYLKMASESVGE